MKLYKYKSLSNLWHVLDIVLNDRLYCACRTELNDPMEARYRAYAENPLAQNRMVSKIEQDRDVWRVASLSADKENFLLWSYYADGHKGIAIEVDIPKDHSYLTNVTYTWVEPVYTHSSQTEYSMRDLFREKGEEWLHEKEYRIITKDKFFQLPKPVRKILVGHRADPYQVNILKKAVEGKAKKGKIVPMELDRERGRLVIVPSKRLQPTWGRSETNENVDKRKKK